jgi:hypothetical protein
MTAEELAQLTQKELAQEAKKQKNNLTLFVVFLCLMMGIAIWSATHKGSFLIACIPLFLMPILGKLDKKHKAVKAEMQARNLNN